jgi:hypothetical protein
MAAIRHISLPIWQHWKPSGQHPFTPSDGDPQHCSPGPQAPSSECSQQTEPGGWQPPWYLVPAGQQTGWSSMQHPSIQSEAYEHDVLPGSHTLHGSFAGPQFPVSLQQAWPTPQQDSPQRSPPSHVEATGVIPSMSASSTGGGETAPYANRSASSLRLLTNPCDTAPPACFQRASSLGTDA